MRLRTRPPLLTYLLTCLLSCEPLALPRPGESRVELTPILGILAS